MVKVDNKGNVSEEYIYLSADDENDYIIAQANEVVLIATKEAQDIIEEFLGGLRSTMTYIGAKRLKDIPKQCVFYQVHNQLNRMYESTTIGK